jgi:hypothetical protein
VIKGGRAEAQFRDIWQPPTSKLTREERRRLDEVSPPPLIYSFWRQRNTASHRLGEADMT